MFHEFAHRVIIQNFGLTIAGGLNPQYAPEAAEAAGLDEGLADYFTAAATDDPQIHGRIVVPPTWIEIDRVLRDLSRVVLYPWCDGAYGVRDPYFGGKVIGGSLWDLRTRLSSLRGVDPFELDRTVYGQIAMLQTVPVEARTLRAFRDALLATPLGTAYYEDFLWAFDRHNIRPAPNDKCTHTPRITDVHSSIGPSGQEVSVSWVSVPDASSYRLYVQRFGSSGQGVSPGELVADDIVDTSYVYAIADTAVILSFRVAAVDTAGDEGPASDEVPAVTSSPEPGLAPLPGLDMRLSPNPTTGNVLITFRVRGSTMAQAAIFDIAGRRIRSLDALEFRSAGEATILWDGRDARAAPVPSGVYLIRVEAGQSIVSRRLIIAR